MLSVTGLAYEKGVPSVVCVELIQKETVVSVMGALLKGFAIT